MICPFMSRPMTEHNGTIETVYVECLERGCACWESGETHNYTDPEDGKIKKLHLNGSCGLRTEHGRSE